MNNSKITVFIVDDDPAVRDALQLMIEQEGYRVNAFASGNAFLAAYQPAMPACLLLDLKMPGLGGLEVQEALAKQNDLIPIVFLTGHGSIPTGVKAIKAGAVDFLTKPITRDALISSLREAIKESERKGSQHLNNHHAKSLLEQLTERESEVMALAALGYLNKEIARNLGISHRTVEIHKSKIMQKTGANNLLDLASIAYEGGLVSKL